MRTAMKIMNKRLWLPGLFDNVGEGFRSPVPQHHVRLNRGVVTRDMGMVLAAIAMGMLADGLKGLLPGLAG